LKKNKIALEAWQDSEQTLIEIESVRSGLWYLANRKGIGEYHYPELGVLYDDIMDVIESNIHLFINKCYCWTFDFVSNGSFFKKDFAEGFSDKSIDLDLALCNKVIEVLLGRGFKIEETCRNQSSYMITISV